MREGRGEGKGRKRREGEVNRGQRRPSPVHTCWVTILLYFCWDFQIKSWFRNSPHHGSTIYCHSAGKPFTDSTLILSREHYPRWTHLQLNQCKKFFAAHGIKLKLLHRHLQLCRIGQFNSGRVQGHWKLISYSISSQGSCLAPQPTSTKLWHSPLQGSCLAPQPTHHDI